MMISEDDTTCRSAAGGAFVRRRHRPRPRLDMTAADASLSAVIEHLPCGVTVVDAAGHMRLTNGAARRIRGGSFDPARPVAEQMSRDYAARDAQTGRPLAPAEMALARALMGETVDALVYIYRRPGDAEDRWTQASAVPLRDATGRITGAVTIFTDVTRERQLMRELSASEERLRTVYAAMACDVVIQDARGVISYANAAAEEILGLTLDQMRGRTPLEARWQATWEDGTDLSDAEHPAMVALHTRQPQRTITMGIAGPDGRRRWLHVDAVPMLGADGAPVQVVTSFTDITARMQAEAALADQALRDALTGLPNRTLLRDRLGQALHADAHADAIVALFLLDLNRFKEVNDTLGHHYGDLLLQQVGARIQGGLCAPNTVARLGGDEFAVLLPATDAAGAVRAAHKILAALSAPITVEERCLTVSASIGVALSPDHGTDATTLLRRADVAMYVAKRAGSGYAVYDARHDQHTPARLMLEGELRQAITQGNLLLHYQPKVEVQTGRIDCVEALVRWPHPAQGLIPPDQFIPLAEQTGLIVPLTQWVLATALRQCQAWRRAGLALGIAVNLSMRTLLDPQLPDSIAWLLRRHELEPGALTLEITESALMADPAQARAVLARLSGLGVGISIDDFGTGYSSLGYLKQLPVDEIKIDKSFVLSMNVDATDTAIVRSISELSHNLGLRVVAEGVENRAAWDLLAELGCDTAQGYFLSRPLPAEELGRWMSDHALQAG